MIHNDDNLYLQEERVGEAIEIPLALRAGSNRRSQLAWFVSHVARFRPAPVHIKDMKRDLVSL